jgi:hypothetical protein
MNRTLKVLSLGLLLAIAASGVAVMQAAANQEGHFVTDLTHADVSGVEDFVHRLHYVEHGSAGEIGCDETSYKATAISATKTLSELIFTPAYGKCYTTPDGETGSVAIHVNGCTVKFTVAKGTTDNTEQTFHLQCPPGAAIVLTHPNCKITFHPQTVNTGITYTTKVDPIDGKHYLTLHLNVQVTTTKHNLCQFFGTNGVGTLKGTLPVSAFVPNSGNAVNLTAT